MFQCIKLCDEAKEKHQSLVNLLLPENELEKQNHWFHSACFKAQTGKAAVMEQVATLRTKPELEAQKELLKRKKELELETELPATNQCT